MDEHGASNLPQPPGGNSQNHTSVFDLGVRHAQLQQGEVYFNDRNIPLDADLRDFGFTVSFDPSPQRYSGTLDYQGGRPHFGPYAPIPHQSKVRFAATRLTLVLNGLELASGPSRLRLDATLRNYYQPSVEARYDASLDAGDLRLRLKTVVPDPLAPYN